MVLRKHSDGSSVPAGLRRQCEGLGTPYLIEIDNADALHLARHVSGRRRSQLPDSR